MAETTEKPKAPAPGKKEKGAGGGGGGGGGGQSGKGKDKGGASAVDHAPKAAEGTPRLRLFYQQTVRGKLQKEFGLSNPHEVPRLEKVVLNVGMGDAGKNPKQLEAAVEELGLITGQKAVVTKAKKAIANFGLRAGMPVGCTVTLAGRADVRVSRSLHHPGDPPHSRLPRAAQPQLRRAGQLHVRYQGADDLPRDRLRQG